jgi:outer membrane protein assembly factor BamB
MATLEVHDGEGRVEFVELGRDHPVLFGTSTACDVVLSGEGILPVHGRIRWKKGRYKVEASPDAQYVVINGHKMTTSSLHQGDEMTIGPCRLFLLRLDEPVDALPVGRPVRHRDEEKTRVLEGPFLHAAPPPAGAAARRPSGQPQPGGRRPSNLERGDWLESLEMGRHSESFESLPSASPAKQPDRGTRRPSAAAKPSAATRPSDLKRWLGRLGRIVAAPQAAPGQESILSSPLVLALVVSLGLLILLGLGLRSIISRTMANQGYNRALEVFQDGDYRTAIRDFDSFLASYPEDPRAGKAKVFRALANVRQYVSVSGGTWSTALEAAREMFENLGTESEFRDERVELADLVIRIGEGLADRARHAADEKALREAESAVPLHAAIAGEPAPAFLKKSRLPGLLSEARAAVRKSQVRLAALETMDLAIKNGSASGVYKARDSLIEQYADLAQERELISRMTQANDLVRRAVKVESKTRVASTSPHAVPLGPPTSLVLRSAATPASPATPPAADSIVFGLADGLAYALDSTTGAPLWQLAVGVASPFAPQPVPGEATVLVVDAGRNELLRLDARTGRLLWRLELGEPVDGPPLVLGDQLYQVLPGGKLLVINLKSGESRTTVDLGMPLSRPPVSDELGRFLYIAARRDCLFVLARDPIACGAVEYLGHEEGSIPCAPARVGRFLIIPENDRPGDGRWRVLVLDEEGARVRPVQQVEIPGWTWATPPSSGSVIWAAGDKGGVEAYALGDYASKTPLRSLSKMSPDLAASGPAFGLAASDRELWLAAGPGRSGRYELDPERGELALKSGIPQAGPALSSIQATSRYVVGTFQDPETGGTSLYGIDRTTGAVAWQTVLGATWSSPLENSRSPGALRTVGRTGQQAELAGGLLEAGGFLTLPLPRPGKLKLPTGRALTLEGDGPAATVLVPGAGSGSVWVREGGGQGAWRKFELPTTCAAMPLLWGRDLLIPGVDGRAYLIDPVAARSKAEPLVPIYDKDRRGAWLSPVRIGDSSVILADDSGKIRRLGLKQGPVTRLSVEAETILDKGIVAGPATTGDAVIVVTADQRARALSARDLSPLGAWALDAPAIGAPATVGDRCYVYDASGGVLVIGRDGRRLWSVRLEDEAVGPPVVRDEMVWFLDRAGRLEGRSPADGSPKKRRDLGILPAGGLIVAGPRTFVPVARGTIREIGWEPGPTPKP